MAFLNVGMLLPLQCISMPFSVLFGSWGQMTTTTTNNPCPRDIIKITWVGGQMQLLWWGGWTPWPPFVLRKVTAASLSQTPLSRSLSVDHECSPRAKDIHLCTHVYIYSRILLPILPSSTRGRPWKSRGSNAKQPRTTERRWLYQSFGVW